MFAAASRAAIRLVESAGTRRSRGGRDLGLGVRVAFEVLVARQRLAEGRFRSGAGGAFGVELRAEGFDLQAGDRRVVARLVELDSQRVRGGTDAGRLASRGVGAALGLELAGERREKRGVGGAGRADGLQVGVGAGEDRQHRLAGLALAFARLEHGLGGTHEIRLEDRATFAPAGRGAVRIGTSAARAATPVVAGAAAVRIGPSAARAASPS